MKMRILVILLFIVVSSECSALPNFVVAFMDDMGWGDLGCFGNSAMETPNLDRLAREGTLLTDLYVANPLCTPSRAALLTGRLPVRNGFYTTNAHARNSYALQTLLGGIQDNEVLLPELLRQRGYSSKLIGKWHLGHRDPFLPLRHGFDEYFGVPNTHPGPFDGITAPNIPVYDNDEMVGRLFEGDFQINLSTHESNLTMKYLNASLDFIRRNANQSRPFFLYYAPDASHDVVYASRRFLGRSRRGPYGDAVMELDWSVGEIARELQRLGIDDNTLIFFSSDNGAATWLHEMGGLTGPFLCGKQTTFEGGVRSPGIAWGMGTGGGAIIRQQASLMDLFPTFLKMAGIEVPSNLTLDGIDLSKQLFIGDAATESGFQPESLRPIFHYRGDELFAVRIGLHKTHLWTWTCGKELGFNFCPGEVIDGVTTSVQTNRTTNPIVYHLGRDPGEKFPLSPKSHEYQNAVTLARVAVEKHKASLKMAEPQMNWCDLGAQNWRPKGCEKLGQCLKGLPSKQYKCVWDF